MRISEALGDDHQYLDELYEKIKSAQSTDDKTKWRNALTWNLARHVISEELTVYPAMEKWLGEEGKALTKDDFAQHQAVCVAPSALRSILTIFQVKNVLSILQDLSPTDAKFSPLLEQLMTDLDQHIEHESQEDMPKLEAAISTEESEAIALQFARTKKIVPTRSHAETPTSHWAVEGLMGLMHAPVDKLRDLVRSFPDGMEEQGKQTEVDWMGML